MHATLSLAIVILSGCQSAAPAGPRASGNAKWLDGAPSASNIRNGGTYVKMIEPLKSLPDEPLATPYNFQRSLIEINRLEDHAVVQLRMREKALFSSAVTVKGLTDAIKSAVASAESKASPPLSQFEKEYLTTVCISELLRRNTERATDAGIVFKGEFAEFGGFRSGAFDPAAAPDQFGEVFLKREMDEWHVGKTGFFGKQAGRLGVSNVGLSRLFKILCNEVGLKGWIQGAAVSNFVSGNIGVRIGPNDTRQALGMRLEGVRSVVGEPFSLDYACPMNVIEFSDGTLGFACPGLARELFWTFGNGNLSGEPARKLYVDVTIPKCQWELDRFFGLVFPIEKFKLFRGKEVITKIAGDPQSRTGELTKVSEADWLKSQASRLKMDRELIPLYLKIEDQLRGGKE